MSNTTFPMTAAPRMRSLAVHTPMCSPLGLAPAVAATAIAVNSIAERVDVRVDVNAYGSKQGRPPRGVPR